MRFLFQFQEIFRLECQYAFVAKLDPGGALAYSTTLGITLAGEGKAIAVDGSGKGLRHREAALPLAWLDRVLRRAAGCG